MLSHKTKAITAAIIGGIAIMSASSAHARDLSGLSVDEIRNINEGTYQELIEGQKQDLRLKALEDVATRIGAQKGLYDSYKLFKEHLEKNEDLYDQIFDFRRLMTLARSDQAEAYLLPAVVSEVNDEVSLENQGKSLTLAGKIYEILEEERLVTAPPTWWDYLYVEPNMPTIFPPAQLLPQNDSERELWRRWVDEGYQAGLNHADFELNKRVDRLKRDYTGMQRYIRLLEVNMIDEPVVTSRDIMVKGDVNRTTLRETHYKITSATTLNQDVENWKPLFVKDERESMRAEEEYYKVIKIKNIDDIVSD